MADVQYVTVTLSDGTPVQVVTGTQLHAWYLALAARTSTVSAASPDIDLSTLRPMAWFMTPHGPQSVIEPATIAEFRRRDYAEITAQQAADYFAGAVDIPDVSFVTGQELPAAMAAAADDADSAFSVSLRAASGRVAPIRRARGAWCHTLDDAYADHDTIRQMADARGQRITLAVHSGGIGQANRMTSAQIAAAFAAGHEISSHSVTHRDISSLTLAERIAEYDNSKAALEAIVGAGNVRTWTYPFGSQQRNATTDKELHLRYDRILNTGSNSGDSGSPFVYRTDELRAGATPFLIGRFPWTSTNHQRMLALIRLAATTPVVVLSYAHDPDTANNPTMAQVTEAMDLAASLGVPCVTTEEAFPAQSILADPGFEDPTLGSWAVDLGGVVGNVAESVADTPAAGMPGSRSLHLVQTDSSGTKYVYVSQQVPVIPGLPHTLSCKYRSNTTGASFTRMRARTRDYLGAVITQNQNNLTNVQTTWADGALVYTPESNAVSVSIEFIINQNVGEAWFDHVHHGPTALGVLG